MVSEPSCLHQNRIFSGDVQISASRVRDVQKFGFKCLKMDFDNFCSYYLVILYYLVIMMKDN